VGLCLSQDGACTDSFENVCENSLKGDLSNDITLNPPLFSLVNTFFIIQTYVGYKQSFQNLLFLVLKEWRVEVNCFQGLVAV
jgi:hypothetical protein